jgi:hypothetical protein
MADAFLGESAQQRGAFVAAGPVITIRFGTGHLPVRMSG